MQFTLMPACHVMATLGRPLHETRDDSSRDETHPSMKFTACLHARRRRVHSYLHSYLTSSLSNWRYLIGQKFGGQNCRKFGLAPKVLSAEKFCPPKILSAENFCPIRYIFWFVFLSTARSSDVMKPHKGSRQINGILTHHAKRTWWKLEEIFKTQCKILEKISKLKVKFWENSNSM